MKFMGIDESGDPSYKRGTRHFVVAGVVVSSRKECQSLLDGLVSDYPKYFRGKKFKKEIKFSLLNDSETIYFLSGLKTLNYTGFCTCIDTYKFPESFDLNKIDIGLRKTMIVVLTIVNALEVHDIGKIEIDKGAVPEEALDTLQKRMNEKYVHAPKIRPRKSHNSPEIQIADLVAGSVREHLKGENIFFSHIKDRITKIEFKW